MAQASGQRSSVPTLVKNFYQTHGASGFVSKGLGAEMMRATFSRVIKFWLQPIFHQRVFNAKQKDGTPFSKGIAGSLATIPEVIAISPFENAKLAQQLDAEGKFKGTADTMRHLIRTRGVVGLYIGYTGMQLRQMLWTGGYFFSLDIFRHQTDKIFGRGKMSDTASGFCAGVFGTTLNCWCDVVRTVIQKQAVAETFNPEIVRPPLTPGYFISGVTDMFKTAADIAAKRGLAGLYSGFLVKSCYLGGSGAFLAVLVPRFKQMWGCSKDVTLGYGYRTFPESQLSILMLPVESIVANYADGGTLLVTSVQRDARKGIQMSVRASVGGKEYHRRLDPDELIKLRLSLGIVFNDYDTTVGARRKSASEFATKSLLPALATVGKCRVSMDNGECIVTFSVPLEDYGQIKGRLSLPQAHAVLEPLCMTLAREAKRLKWSVEQLQRKLHDAEILLEAAKSNSNPVAAAAGPSAVASSTVEGGAKRPLLLPDSGGTPMAEASAKKAKNE
ncbi:hypothetical protein FOZ62_027432 [Perkinsus olseni]|uniref:Mitochondrial carrier protein n=1 Tax=Perkinsus olseni TaxID=32597 RepID=A0A7J6TY22_PEROL|nr:hypothetical protein FOZ62_027432 [Perkinsus olseni]